MVLSLQWTGINAVICESSFSQIQLLSCSPFIGNKDLVRHAIHVENGHISILTRAPADMCKASAQCMACYNLTSKCTGATPPEYSSLVCSLQSLHLPKPGHKIQGRNRLLASHCHCWSSPGRRLSCLSQALSVISRGLWERKLQSQCLSACYAAPSMDSFKCLKGLCQW